MQCKKKQMAATQAAIDLCIDPYDPAKLPWFNIQVRTINIGSRTSLPLVMTRLSGSVCAAGGTYASNLLAGGIDKSQLWKLVPTKRTIGNQPIFEIHDQNGVVDYAEYYAAFAGHGYALFGRTKIVSRTEFNILGITLDGVT